MDGTNSSSLIFSNIFFLEVACLLLLAFAENLAGLESLELIDVVVENSEALAKSPKLQYVYVKNAKGFDLEALKKNPNLKRVTLSKKDFKEDQVKGFADGVKVSLN